MDEIGVSEKEAQQGALAVYTCIHRRYSIWLIHIAAQQKLINIVKQLYLNNKILNKNGTLIP